MGYGVLGAAVPGRRLCFERCTALSHLSGALARRGPSLVRETRLMDAPEGRGTRS